MSFRRLLGCVIVSGVIVSVFFFFNDTATTEIYTLSLHDALPIAPSSTTCEPPAPRPRRSHSTRDRKSTRLNSSHVEISYAVFCLKKKNKNKKSSLLSKKSNKARLRRSRQMHR